jgi:hypothetical protein
MGKTIVRFSARFSAIFGRKRGQNSLGFLRLYGRGTCHDAGQQRQEVMVWENAF